MILKKKRSSLQPETTKVVRPLMLLMRARGWYVKKIHGSQYQSGLPDLFAAHPKYGSRWIECKWGNNFLSAAQIKEFAAMDKAGVGIWVLRSPDEYDILLKPANWRKSGTRALFKRNQPIKGF